MAKDGIVRVWLRFPGQRCSAWLWLSVVAPQSRQPLRSSTDVHPVGCLYLQSVGILVDGNTTGGKCYVMSTAICLCRHLSTVPSFVPYFLRNHYCFYLAQFYDSKFTCQGDGRDVTRVQATGSVRCKFNITTKG